MKRFTLTLLALGASLFAGYAFAQTKAATPAAPAPASAPAPKQQKLARVATITGIEQNREFQNNVQILQNQRQAAIELNDAMQKEKDPKKKAELKTQVDQALARLNENNDKMHKTYGFSLARNYTLIIETAHIYMFVTDEEAAAIEKAEKEEAARKAGAQKAPAATKKK